MYSLSLSLTTKASSRALSQQAMREPACATTDPQGHYTLAELVAADYTIAASAPTYRPSIYKLPGTVRGRRIALAAGEAKQGIDLVLRGGGIEITGTVADVTGGPIAQALVRAGYRGGTTPPVETPGNGG